MKKSQGRILIIRGGDLTDFVMTCPVLAALRVRFPDTSLEVLGYPRIAELGKAAGFIDEIRSIETRAAAVFFARNANLNEDLGKYFASFAIIFSYLYDPDGFFEANVRRVSQAQYIAGPARPQEGENIHATAAFLKPLEKVAIFGANAEPQLIFPRLQTSAVPLLAINPGREDPSKNWHEAKWRSLLRALIEKTAYRILLVASETDPRAIQRLIGNLPPDRIHRARDFTYCELAVRLAGCQAYVGPASGILQLAAATGIPTVAIWGTTHAAIWKPPGKNVTLLRHRLGINAITVEEVLSSLPMVWTGAE